MRRISFLFGLLLSSVAFGQVSGGNSDSTEVNQTVRKYLSQVKTCHDISLKSNPSIAGQIDLVVVITEGIVSLVSLTENTTGASDVATCISRKIKRWQFPSTVTKSTVLSFTLGQRVTFTSSESESTVNAATPQQPNTVPKQASSYPDSNTGSNTVAPKSNTTFKRIESAMGVCSDEINKTVRKYLSQVKTCHDISLKSNPSVAGRLEVDIEILDGKVTAASVSKNTTGDGAVATCIERKVARWKFPATCSDSAVLSFTLGLRQ